MKLNNKGFTFVEILAVIAIIGILSGIAIVGVSRYREQAKNKDYEALAKSSYNAMEEYMMAHPYKEEATLKTLDEGDFLSNRIDPATKNTNCEGSVKVEKVDGNAGSIDDGKYIVYLCCTNYKKMYTYPDGEVKDIDDPSKCEVTETGPDDYVIPEPLPGEVTYNITYNLNGGTVTGNPNKYSKSMLPFNLKNPTRSGYTFTGWTGSNGTTPQTTVTLPKGSQEDKTYTANWKANSTSPSSSSYTITLNNNGATKAGTANVKVQEGDTNLSKITKPVKEVTITYVNNVGATVSGGDKTKTYTLNGWYTAASGGNKVASNSDTPILQKSISGYTDKNGKWTKKSNTTLYAQWAPVTATLPIVTKTGYTCKWTTSGGERASGGTWTFSSANARTFTAVCTANTKTVTITFHKNGSSTETTKSCTYNTSTQSGCSITSPKITRAGYTKVGWNTKSSDKTSSWDQDTAKTFSSNATYYAITYKTLTASFDYKMSTKKDLTKVNSVTNPKVNKTCKMYNTATSCKITTPTCNLGVTINNHHNPKHQPITEYFTIKWGTTLAGNDVEISTDKSYTISVTPKSEYVNKNNKIILYSEDGNNNIQIRNNDTPTYGIAKRTLIGYFDDNQKFRWDGNWLVDTADDKRLWIHGKGVTNGKKCRSVYNYNTCNGHYSAAMEGYVSTKATRY